MSLNSFQWIQLEDEAYQKTRALLEPTDRHSSADNGRLSISGYEFSLAALFMIAVLGFMLWYQTDQRLVALEAQIENIQSQPEGMLSSLPDEDTADDKPALSENALNFSAIKDQWHILAQALDQSKYEYSGKDSEWQPEHLNLDYTISLQSTLKPTPNPVDEILWQHAPSTSLSFSYNQRAAGLFADFVVSEYGIETIPTLLDAFTRHENWVTLAPDIFELSATEFEAAWDAYLKETYPLNYKG